MAYPAHDARCGADLRGRTGPGLLPDTNGGQAQTGERDIGRAT